ncbi:FHA domain-containing protein [Streptomyces sp. NPDC097619]|uniref:FHA domain-containing protein n=1 Tax=Streptomyces sp. NPDC097619 TaxID=3157228 RepID=UPI0033229619
MPTCPNGHASVSEDWCEVCGIRMTGAGAPPAGAAPGQAPSYGYGFPPPGGQATAQAELCPQCRTPREAMAPFCEECRYNFLTRTATSYTPVSPQGPGHPGAPGQGPGMNLPPGYQPQHPQQQHPQHQQPQHPQQQHPGAPQGQDPYEYQGSRPSQVNRPAEPLGGDTPGGPPRPPGLHPNAPVLPPLPGFEQPPAPGRPGAPGQPRPAAPTGSGDWNLTPPGQQQSAPPFPGHPGQHQGHPGQQQGHPGQHQPYPQGGGSWSATIGPDRTYFMAMMRRSGPEAAGLNLPAYSPEQHLPLTGGQITIGRRRQSTGEAPTIDLSVPPEDPGVSHQHAVLVQQPDGSWAVVDQNSTNGTTINGGEEPIQPYVPVPLGDGDQVHVGAWTTITIRRG